MEFKSTTKHGIGRASHSHILYLNEETGEGYCSPHKNHVHEVRFQEPVEPEVDEEGNPLTEGIEGGWYVVPAEDGHTHEIIEVEKRNFTTEEEDDEVIQDVIELWKTATRIEEKSLKAAKESEDFYMGKQWEDEDISYLKGLDRVASTTNKIEKGVDNLCGLQRENRTEIKYMPEEGGDQAVADLANVVVGCILRKSEYARQESKAFEDAVVTGRGWLMPEVDFNKDLRGEILIRKFPYDEVRVGPHSEEDLSDCEYLIKHKMFSFAKLKQLYGDKADEISKDMDLYLDESQFLKDGDPADRYAETNSPGKLMPQTIHGERMVDIATKEFRRLECWRVIYQPVTVLAHRYDGYVVNTWDWKPGDIKKAKEIPDFVEIKKTQKMYRISTIAGNTLLSDENPADLPVDDFAMFPIYAKKRGNNFWGKVENAKQPQKEYNRRNSQTIDIGNKMCAYGYYYDEGTFASQVEEKKWLANNTSPGFAAKLSDASRPPTREEGSKLPSEIIQLMEIAERNISDAMNITVEEGGANESYQHLLERRRDKLRGNEFLFDNLSHTKKRLGRYLLGLVQRYYDADRILRLVQTETPEGVDPNFDEATIEKFLYETDLADYDVIVEEIESSPTLRQGTFMMLKTLAEAGQPIPPTLMIEYADIPQSSKDAIIEDIMAQQESMAAEGSDAYRAEENKALIAQGIIPPDVKRRMEEDEQAAMQEQQQPQELPLGDGAFPTPEPL